MLEARLDALTLNNIDGSDVVNYYEFTYRLHFIHSSGPSGYNPDLHYRPDTQITPLNCQLRLTDCTQF